MMKSKKSKTKNSEEQIDFYSFFHNYYGHHITELETVHSQLEKKHRIFLVGDSSLDNKHWVKSIKVPAVNGYEKIIQSGKAAPDICHCLNVLLENANKDYCAINCAVEESTIGVREKGKLLVQDLFVKNNLQEDDILIASVGGNDIALKPTISTILSILWMCKISSLKNIKDGSAIGFGHFKDMFKTQIESYLKNLCEKSKAKKILVCMIYYPHEMSGGWADYVLNKLNYDSNPKILQTMISSIFEHATKEIRIEGVEIIPIPLFEILDSSPESIDYVARVEPSQEGGVKMAEYFYKKIFES